MTVIEWAPLNRPIHRRLETLCVLWNAWEFLFAPLTFMVIFLYILLKTEYYYLSLLYAAWYIYDLDTCDRGGRLIPIARKLPCWRYYCNYFPIRLHKTAEIDPSRNYIFGYHPHGIMGAGAFGGFCTDGAGFSHLFPGIVPHLVTLVAQFRFPIHREVLLSAGAISANKESIEYVLNPKRPGHSCVLLIGGAVEALDAVPGTMKLTLKNRKGFVKLALKKGAGLVPVLSFGENDIFHQDPRDPNSFLTKFQYWVHKIVPFTTPVFHGRGIFQYTFGFLPYRHPIDIIVGKPIEIEKIEKPTQEDIDRYHQKYIDALHQLFNENKDKYAKDHPQMKLEII